MQAELSPRLDIFCTNDITIRRETVSRHIGRSILFLSDLHLGAPGSKRLVSQLIETIASVRADVILFGGDLLDWIPAWELLEELLSTLPKNIPWGVVSGNHDRIAGFDRLKNIIKAAGGIWLEDGVLEIQGVTTRLLITGNPQASYSNKDFNILCLHDPSEIMRAPKDYFKLVLAGHLHGSQCVLQEKNELLYPGAFFFRWNGLRFRVGETLLIVSRGLHDSIPIRYNCPREVILCQI
ncbi:metallophosphoesterase family protein [bacterium]|nr:metallophosphoesterase family protein [bacterium]